MAPTLAAISGPANLKKDRKDRRLAENQTGKRRVVIVARERKGRTLTTVTRQEADGVGFVFESRGRRATLWFRCRVKGKNLTSATANHM